MEQPRTVRKWLTHWRLLQTKVSLPKVERGWQEKSQSANELEKLETFFQVLFFFSLDLLAVHLTGIEVGNFLEGKLKRTEKATGSTIADLL